MQIVGYKWKSNGARNIFHDSWEPHLLLENGGEMEKMPLLNRDISIKMGERFCIGHFSDGKHVKCPTRQRITSGWYCDSCKRKDDFFSCVQCSGDCTNDKQRKVCREGSYFVYLAVFDSLLKVGISQEHRLFERLIEQGADFAAKIAFVKDGMIVRRIEQDLKKGLNCKDRVRGEEKHKRIFGDPNASIITITESLAILKDRFDINAFEVYDLRKFYKLENVARRPKMITVKKDLDIRGRIVASKGNLLILKNGFYYSLNAHELIGREAEIVAD